MREVKVSIAVATDNKAPVNFVINGEYFSLMPGCKATIPVAEGVMVVKAWGNKGDTWNIRQVIPHNEIKKLLARD